GPTFAVTTPPVGGTGTIMPTDATFAAGASASFTVVLHVAAAAPGASTIDNTATISSNTTDTNAANDASTASATVLATTDLAVVKTGPATVTAGTDLTYTLTLTNNGPSDAQTVSLTDAVPAGTTFVSATPAPGFTATTPAVGGTGTISFAATSMAAGASATFTV